MSNEVYLKNTDIPRSALNVLDYHGIKLLDELNQCPPPALLFYFRKDHKAYGELKQWLKKKESHNG